MLCCIIKKPDINVYKRWKQNSHGFSRGPLMCPPHFWNHTPLRDNGVIQGERHVNSYLVYSRRSTGFDFLMCYFVVERLNWFFPTTREEGMKVRRASVKCPRGDPAPSEGVGLPINPSDPQPRCDILIMYLVEKPPFGIQVRGRYVVA